MQITINFKEPELETGVQTTVNPDEGLKESLRVLETCLSAHYGYPIVLVGITEVASYTSEGVVVGDV